METVSYIDGYINGEYKVEFTTHAKERAVERLQLLGIKLNDEQCVELAKAGVYEALTNRFMYKYIDNYMRYKFLQNKFCFRLVEFLPKLLMCQCCRIRLVHQRQL